MNTSAEHMEINDDVLISYLLREASAEQALRVDEWLKVPANERHFNQFKIIWETSKNLKLNELADALTSLQKLKEKAAGRQPKQGKIIELNNRYGWLKVAAAILLIAFGTWFYISQRTIKQLQFATEASVLTDTLPDGSVITLNRHSLLQYPKVFTGGQRNVTLSRGEAFFNVTHSREKPFIITAGGAIIKVVGTSFNVKNKGGNIEVIVETGIVQVSKNGNVVAVKPGEKVIMASSSPAIVKQKTPDHLYTYYRSREFVADDVPLRRMVQVLNEAYDSNIVIGRKELNELPLNTTFKNESLEDVLQIISHTFNIKIEKKHNQIILK
jgi:transmembrane sensor